MPAALVVVPVHGNLPLAERCLRALDQTTPTEAPLLVVDDCGSERVTTEWLDHVVASARPCELLRNEENLGFVRTANRGFERREERDVLLVNSDVVTFPGWYVGMQASVRDDWVASVTATSNAASIATIAGGRKIGSPEELRGLASQARLRGAATVTIPVGVGHCMLFRDETLRDVGLFDEAFSPGYGEEVDWSIRARRRGWRHVAARHVLVWHDGEGTFGAQGLLRKRHELRLALRYPREFIDLRRRPFVLASQNAGR